VSHDRVPRGTPPARGVLAAEADRTAGAAVDLDRLAEVATGYGMHVYAERALRLHLAVGADGGITVTVKETTGVSVRRGGVDVAVPVAGVDGLARAAAWAARRTRTLAPGRYLFGDPDAGTTREPAGDRLWPPARLAPVLDQLTRARRPGGDYGLGFVAESVVRSVAMSAPAGTAVKDDGWSRLSCFATASDGGGLAKHTRIGEWLCDDGVDAAVLADLVERTGVDADRLRNADPTGAATGPVLFEPRAAGAMIHEVVGHILERDNVLARRHGQPLEPGHRIATELLTVEHDGTLAEAWSGAAVDDQGTPTSRTVLVDRGVVARHLGGTDGADSGTDSGSGDARRAGFEVPALARMRTLRVRAGADEDGALLADLDRGLLVRTLRRAMLVPGTGRCVAEIGEAGLIERGRVTGTSRGGTIACGFADILGGIDGVGSDLGVTHDLCDKAGQRLPTTAWSPRIRVRDLPVRSTR
jgi:predicted Zn-dependent protease